MIYIYIYTYIYKNTPLTSIIGSQSKAELITCATGNNCEMQESLGKNQDWHFVKS